MDPPRFNLKLLDDPAFSPDPRSHPHFSLAHALPVPSKSPSPHLRFHSLPPQVLRNVSTNTPRRTRMKAFVRRLTARHNLDRIDELDETDPFGDGFHHDGPYEAVVSSLAQPTPQRITAPPKPIVHRSKRESDPHPLRVRHHQSAHRSPPPYAETGLSLHLKPGQILQQNTIYSSYPPDIAPSPGQSLPQMNSVSIATTRPDPPRRQSLPNPRTRPYQDPSSYDLLDGSQGHQSSSPPTHRERYLGDYAPVTPNTTSLHHDLDAPPYVHHQTPKTVVPPPRYESRLHSSGPPRSPQRIPPPSLLPTPPRSQSTENVVLAPRHDSQHKTVHSSDSSPTHKDTSTRSSSNKPLDPPRIRYLPKRLVMPAPLQPLQPQAHHKSPPAEPPTWQGGYTDVLSLESVHFHAKPAMYNQEPRLLRKKSSAFPAGTPIPDHVPVSQDDAISTIGNLSTKTVNEAEATKEGSRRRRLSKRKNDI